MLFAGSDDGVYRVEGLREGEETTAERVLDAERVFRVRRLPGLEGLFVTAESGLYHSPDGEEWRALDHPGEAVYAVAADPSGERLYTGTRPARVFVADCRSGPPTDADAWRALPGFDELREDRDWGLPRHDHTAQVRSLCTHPGAPGRVVAGVEVGGVHVSDDRGDSWHGRTIDGFDAPHTDDVHHLALDGPDGVVASTGSGLFRSTDAGRSWARLDADHRQRYFREAFADGGSVYAGGAPASSSSWEEDTDHALFESGDGGPLERADSPAPDEVAIGWCAVDGDPVAATHRGSLIRRQDGGWTVVGSVPTPGSVRGRYLPLAWHGDR